MAPFSLLLWSQLRVSLSAFCTSKRCFQIHPNRFPSCLQTLHANIHIQPISAAARFPRRIQNPDDRDRSPGFSRFRAFAAGFPAKRKGLPPTRCRQQTPLNAGIFKKMSVCPFGSLHRDKYRLKNSLVLACLGLLKISSGAASSKITPPSMKMTLSLIHI